MNKFPKVISDIVKNDLCIGCGLCVYKCPTQALKMKWNENGFLVPDLFGNCDLNGLCISVCPFNLNPDNEVKTENELTQLFIDSNFEFHSKIGRYIGLYAGFSNDYRLSSSSGGIATYILLELLEKGIVDYIITVNESNIEKTFYEYSILSSKSEILNASKTKYFPVTLASVMQQINELQGKVAVVGVACFIKAIRLTLYKEPTLNEKIIFLVGIICGGVKSRYFTDYLASKTGVFHGDFTKPQYRVKDLNSTAIDYSFRCIGKKDNIENTIKMSSVGDMWGTGLFKNNACDFCDDVTTELSDISIGDAWIDPYIKKMEQEQTL
jgi:coenzyme F420-reducing hydrogenase beta subunit